MCVSPPTVIVAFNLYVQRMFMFLFLEKYRLVPVFELLHVSTVLYPDDFFFCIYSNGAGCRYSADGN